MKRAKPYRIILVLAIIAAGIVCMLLPDKKVMPTASMKEAVENVVEDTVEVSEMSINE